MSEPAEEKASHLFTHRGQTVEVISIHEFINVGICLHTHIECVTALKINFNY